MQQRQFSFSCAGRQVGIELLCREPPEAQAGKTLTWQLEDSDSKQQRGGAGGEGGSCACVGGGGGGNTPADRSPGASADPDLIGLDIWPASIALCRYLCLYPQLVAGQQVLELGAGEEARNHTRVLPAGARSAKLAPCFAAQSCACAVSQPSHGSVPS